MITLIVTGLIGLTLATALDAFTPLGTPPVSPHAVNPPPVGELGMAWIMRGAHALARTVGGDYRIALGAAIRHMWSLKRAAESLRSDVARNIAPVRSHFPPMAYVLTDRLAA
jgi:hypothetical protein